MRELISRIPLIANLPDMSWRDHKSAATEIVLTLGISFLPIFVVILGDYYDYGSKFLFSDSIKRTIGNGELFLYITAIVAPLFYILLRERHKKQRFPSLISCMVTYGFIIIIAVASFAYQRSANPNQDAVFKMSLIVFGFAFLLNYLVLVYNNSMLPDAGQKIREEEENFSDRVSSHRSAE